MADYPRSLREFQRRFPDDAACGEHLARTRWPEGFACPRCGGRQAWRLHSRTPLTFGCKGCGKETSVTAGTVMHRTHLPLSVWFWAAWLVATHSNGMSAKQLQSELAIASYETAWLLSMKLRAAMVAPERTPLSGLVEADETTIPFRTKDDPPAGGQGRSHDGKLLLIGAVEVVSSKNEKLTLGRLRLAPIADFARTSLHAGTMAAHLVLPGIHRVFANLKTWALGVYHGLRRKHLKAYLDEFVFRFNRRRTRHASFASLLGIAMAIKPRTYKEIIQLGSTG